MRVAGIVVVAIRNLERASFYLVWQQMKKQKQMERESRREEETKDALRFFLGPFWYCLSKWQVAGATRSRCPF